MRYGHQQLDARGLHAWRLADVYCVYGELADIIEAENASGHTEE